MDNKIILYKVEFTYSGIKQPYFMSDTARDKYFEKLQGRQVNGTGVNIKVGKGLALNFKANIDVTVAQDYNFAIVEYNNKKYYCNIIDCEHINVNMCWIYAQRNPLFEITNYWQYYEHFDISQLSTNKFFLGVNTPFVEPKFRYQDGQQISPEMQLTIKGNGTVSSENIYYLDLIFITRTDGEIIRYGYPYNNSLEVLILHRNPQVGKFKLKNGITADADTWIARTYQVQAYIDKGSPDIENIQLVVVPCINTGLEIILPFNGAFTTRRFTLDDGSVTDCHVISVTPIGEVTFLSQISSGPHLLNANAFDYYYTFYLPIYPICKYKLFIGAIDNILEINAFDYIDEFIDANKQIKLEIYPIWGFDGGGYFVKVIPPYSTAKIWREIVYYFPINTTNPFVTDQDALWRSQNKYYNQITESQRQQKKTNSALQTAENIGTGLFQIFKGKPIEGGGNLIRGISSAIQTASDYNYQKEQDDLIAQQARESPSSQFSTTDASASRLFSFYKILIYKQNVYTEDWNSFIENYKYMGSVVRLSKDKLDKNFINTYATIDDNGKWLFVSALPRLGRNSNFQDEVYMQLYQIIKNGCLYKIIEDE